MTNTYWNNQGKHPTLLGRLQRLIPAEGSVDPPALELFRRAANCYYDYYNNGLCNKTSEFHGVFGFGRGASKERIEARMDDFIILAAFEQGMLVEAPEVKE